MYRDIASCKMDDNRWRTDTEQTMDRGTTEKQIGDWKHNTSDSCFGRGIKIPKLSS